MVIGNTHKKEHGRVGLESNFYLNFNLNKIPRVEMLAKDGLMLTTPKVIQVLASQVHLFVGEMMTLQ